MLRKISRRPTGGVFAGADNRGDCGTRLFFLGARPRVWFNAATLNSAGFTGRSTAARVTAADTWRPDNRSAKSRRDNSREPVSFRPVPRLSAKTARSQTPQDSAINQFPPGPVPRNLRNVELGGDPVSAAPRPPRMARRFWSLRQLPENPRRYPGSKSPTTTNCSSKSRRGRLGRKPYWADALLNRRRLNSANVQLLGNNHDAVIRYRVTSPPILLPVVAD